MAERKRYLGDGAYAEWDDFGVILTAGNGISVTDSVYLEPDVYQALVAFVDAHTAPETKSDDNPG